jgi:hypothetical protein
MRVPQYKRLDRKRPVIGVILDNNDDDVKKDFHCVVCGKIAFSYYSDVRVIIPADFHEPHHPSRAPINVWCRAHTADRGGRAFTCNTEYNIF